jgi:hypothetical protein
MDRTHPAEYSHNLPDNMRERSVKVLDHEDPNWRCFGWCVVPFYFYLLLLMSFLAREGSISI